MKTPDYLSYDKYKKKKQTNPKRRLYLFVWTFIISFVAFFAMAKTMAPDVDVTIGDAQEYEYEEKNIGLGVKQFVDTRLRTIDLEDLGKSYSKLGESEPKEETVVEEEKIELPTKHIEEEPIAKAPTEPAVMPAYHEPAPTAPDLLQPVEPTSMVKVYVGRYANVNQARVALDILMGSGLDVSPFVKNVNGIYTLQIGSFDDVSRADQGAGERTRNGFPARLVRE